VSRYQETFLSTEEWMTIPWKFQPKNWRDRLYDLAMGFNEIVASTLGNDKTSSRPEDVTTRVDKALQIESEISKWKLSWFEGEYPHLQIRCNCQSLPTFSCICSIPISRFPTNDFALLQVECWAIKLLISATLIKLVAADGDFTASWVANLPLRSSQIACYMEATPASPLFRRTVEQSSGINEGLCRALLPAWSLREYRRRVNREG
jgi:hypothetical protein